MTKEHRDIYWSPLEAPGLEQLGLDLTGDGIKATGMILRKHDMLHFRCRYELEADPDWRFRLLSFAVTGGPDLPARRLALARLPDGGWQADGISRPDLAGCEDIDIQVTPFTNSLPIRRLGLSKGETRKVQVVYIAVPELELRPVVQRYSCLTPLGPEGGRYRYESLESDFTAELPVDGDGLVIDYPETFRRVWPR